MPMMRVMSCAVAGGADHMMPYQTMAVIRAIITTPQNPNSDHSSRLLLTGKS